MPIHIKGSGGGVQETPVISVNSNTGVITATAGNKTSTMQLPIQAGTTVTPGFSTKPAVEAGTYTTGKVYVKGDTDLLAENIVSGVSIFGVAGSAKIKYLQSESATALGNGSRSISFYLQQAQLDDVGAILINAQSYVNEVYRIINMTVIPHAGGFLCFRDQVGGLSGNEFPLGLPFVTTYGGGVITVDLPSDYGFYFQAQATYSATVVGI